MTDWQRKWGQRIMDKALNYMALARKGGRIELGEEPVGAVARAQHARLVVVASDASDHTWRRALSFVAGTGQQCIRVPYTKDMLGMAIGRTSLAIGAFTDPALALAFLKALPPQSHYAEAIADLEKRARRAQVHRQEEKSHLRNKKRGKK